LRNHIACLPSQAKLAWRSRQGSTDYGSVERLQTQKKQAPSPFSGEGWG